ncbi:hypothetical protein AAGS61_17545 [Lysinibacillus sp. KU-BSD001]|uniref:hypothetical protein n=1 Tax=Lysinibacillus sp. KU-BSD001 TaxID=3141328 RepID=UPI0036EAFE39
MQKSQSSYYAKLTSCIYDTLKREYIHMDFLKIGMLNKHKIFVKFIHSCNTPKELLNAGNNGFMQSLLIIERSIRIANAKV